MLEKRYRSFDHAWRPFYGSEAMQKSHIITPALGPGTSVCRMLLSALACETRARKTGGAAAAPSMSFKILKHFCFEARNPCATAGCGDTEPGGEWMAVCKADCLSNYTLEISVRCTVRLKIVGLAGCDQSQARSPTHIDPDKNTGDGDLDLDDNDSGAVHDIDSAEERTFYYSSDDALYTTVLATSTTARM